MDNIKISVILPVYNTKNYLEEALDSILYHPNDFLYTAIYKR